MSSFMLSPDVLARIARSLTALDSPWAGRDWKKLAEELYELNVAGVRSRYEDRYDIEPFVVSSFGKTSGKVELFKQISCLLYQATEGDVPGKDLFKELDQFKVDLACSIVRALPEYDRLPWGD